MKLFRILILTVALVGGMSFAGWTPGTVQNPSSSTEERISLNRLGCSAYCFFKYGRCRCIPGR